MASEGVRGGYRLAKAPEDITFLDIVDAIEGDKLLFDCQEIRGRCAVFGQRPPSWATSGVCAVHAVMIRAEKAMRAVLAQETLANVADTFGRKAPAEFSDEIAHWIQGRFSARTTTRTSRSS